MTTVEVLKAARGRIEKGWCQGIGRIVNDNGIAIAWCAVGATAQGQEDLGADADLYLECVIGTHAITSWNDAPGRTQAEVIAAFDKAIALAESDQ